MRDFKKLKVWHKAHQLTLSIYQLSTGFPKHELFALASQMRRCSASICANLAEGCGRTGYAEFHRFVQIASGSANELEYHLILARDLGYVAAERHLTLDAELAEIKRMLVGLASKVRSHGKNSADKRT